MLQLLLIVPLLGAAALLPFSTAAQSAANLILLGLAFVGISYIPIYLGAIAVLFLFVIMMLNIKLTDILDVGSQHMKNLPLALTIIALLCAAALLFNVEYIQPIGFCVGIFSVVPVKPADDKPSRRFSLSKGEREAFSLTPELKDILIGLCLGDLNIQKRSGNARLLFEQGTVHKEYLFHLYDLFRAYCSLEPKVRIRKPDILTGKVYSSIHFNTYSLTCFNELYDLFYPAGIKVVASNIGDLVTAKGLAYWIADDGTLDKSTNRVILSTDCFSLEEVTLLVDGLNDKWNLECYKIKMTNGGYRIAIPRRSLPILQSLLGPIMPPMMRHKIGL
jgi:hypothetical protein